jgi:MATE family, multidrug efflux pump
MTSQLTRHPKGSLREMWAISLPLMLTLLSGSFMLFCDRVILAHYATDAMSASVVGGMVAILFLAAAIEVTSIAEVFVGRHNGADEYGKIGRPVWQMLWFSVGTAFVFIPIGLWGGPLLVGGGVSTEHGLPYFRWLMCLGPFFPAQAALSAFFVGIGRVRLVTIVAIISNLMNIGLDILLVFGVPGLFGPLGTTGAAIATGCAEFSQMAVLAIFFLSRANRLVYGTGRWRLHLATLWNCLRIGVPGAGGHIIEMSAWTVLLRILAAAGPIHLTVSAIGQSLFVLVSFATEGIQKGVSAICANFIGAEEYPLVGKALRSSLLFLALLAGLASLPLVFYPDPLIHLFAADYPDIAGYARVACFCVWLYFIADGATWIFAGILTAGGDTKFVMWMNGASCWLFAIVPAWYLFLVQSFSPSWVWAVTLVYGSLNAFCFYLRYRAGRWQAIAIN